MVIKLVVELRIARVCNPSTASYCEIGIILHNS